MAARSAISSGTAGAPPAKASASERLANEGQVFSLYGGSKSCRNCHSDEFASWRHSHHGMAEREIDPSLDERAFVPTRTVLDGDHQVKVAVENGNYDVVPTGLPGTRETFPVARVIGVSPLRQFLVPFPGGRLQTLAASYDPTSNQWFDVFGQEQRKPGEWGHWTGRGMNWNSTCAGCHNTRVRKNYDVASDSFHTSMAERTVSCEACHGPLKAHYEWQMKFGNSGQRDPTLPKTSRERAMNTCGSCHARRTELTGDFRPGDSFDEHYSLSMVDYSDVFYPDGQVREEDYEYTAFLGSRMHFRGVTCLDCHNPHSGGRLLPGNWLCMRCHGGGYPNAPVIDPVGHSHHRVFGYDSAGALTNFDLSTYDPEKLKETGGECVNCHMPQTAYMQRHWRHDHGFTIPDPLLTKEFSIPNACNRCHQDKNTDWSLEWTTRWYGKKMERLTRRRAEWIARAKRGDQSARKGLLELLGQEEIPYWRAVEAGMLAPWAADQDVSPQLARLLDDTNALVRESAVRALGPLADSRSPRIVEAFRRRLADGSRNVRIAAAWALRVGLDPSLAAAKELRDFLDFNSDQPAGQLQWGIYEFARNDPESALSHMQKAVKWDPESPPIRENLAVVLSALNRPAEAVDQLKKAATLAPDDAEVHYKLGLAYSEAGDLDRAVTELRTATRLEPRNAREWYNLGLAQNARGQISEALESLARGESADARDPDIPYARATILARLGRVEEALAATRRALSAQPDFAPAQQLLEMLSRQTAAPER